MSGRVYVPDDQALFTLMEMTPTPRHVALIEALNELVGDGALKFPRQVMDRVLTQADPDTDASLCIWIKTVWRQINCRLPHSFLLDAQGWAQNNGYPEGLDSALGGRESCVPAVVGFLMQMRKAGIVCVAITDDYRPRPGRAPLGEVCGKLGHATIAPSAFAEDILRPLMPEV